jgi:hypothetical protein
MIESPYQGLAVDHWRAKTEELIKAHPLSSVELTEVILKAWDGIYQSSIGSQPFRIGQDIFPPPQLMGFFLHELVGLELQYRYPAQWRKTIRTDEKDLVYIPDSLYSIEIKTSSSKTKIYGNRSYAQIGQSARKSKSGYYLAVNFEKFSTHNPQPQIIRIRFGWLDHDDWIGQWAATGQQARLNPFAEANKLIPLFTVK